MIFEFLKTLAVEILRASGRSDLQRVADWIAETEGTAAKTLAKFIVASFGGGQPITEQAAVQILDAQKNINNKPDSAPEPDDSFLNEYLQLLKTVIKLGSPPKNLLLSGFLNTGDCSSLWVFDKGQSPLVIEKEWNADMKFINTRKSEVEIYLFPAVGDEELKKLNAQLGSPSGKLDSTWDLENGDQVSSIYEDHLVVYKTPIDKRTGTKKNSSAHLNRDELPIDNFDGVGKMASSLPVALAARSGMIDHLRGQVKPLGGVGK